MAWVCWAHVLLRLAPEPETKATSFKQDEVGKMEQIAAIILSELLPCLFTQFSPFKVFTPISPPAQRRQTHIGKCRRFFHPCACQRLCCQTGFGRLGDVLPAKLDLPVDEPFASSHNRQMDWKWFGFYAFVGFKNGFFL